MIQFEIDQVKAILLHLEEVPHKYSANLIKFIKDIAEPQVVKIQQSSVAEIQQPFPEVVAEKQQ
jgi:hypothetical protein